MKYAVKTKLTGVQGIFPTPFLENGDVRISDKTGLIGVELMTYSKTGDHALEFNSKTDKIWKLLSIEVKYELFGDVLLLEILGEAFELYRG